MSTSTVEPVTRLGHAQVVSLRTPKPERLARQGRDTAIRLMAAQDVNEVPALVPGEPTPGECIRFAVQAMKRVAAGPAPVEFKEAFDETARLILGMVYGPDWHQSLDR